MTAAQSVILLCECRQASLFGDGRQEELRQLLDAAGVAVTTVPDLCGLAARRDPWLQGLAATTELQVVACFPRAVQWLLATAGVSPDALTCHNLRVTAPAAIAADLCRHAHDTPVPAAPIPADDWVPWFPVIDYDRCRHCEQCLSFCLFGVYGQAADGRIEVANPENCKTNCPACARVCPELAIIFPKYPTAPVNGGDVGDLAAAREAVRVDLEKLIGDNPYAALAMRRQRLAAARLRPAAGAPPEQRAPETGGCPAVAALAPPARAAACACDCQPAGSDGEPCDCDCDCQSDDDSPGSRNAGCACAQQTPAAATQGCACRNTGEPAC